MLKTSMLNQQGGVKYHVIDHDTRKSGVFPCYRLKINDFLSIYNQNLKVDIFTPLQQILCYCKSRLGTLGIMSWWRVTNFKLKKKSVTPSLRKETKLTDIVQYVTNATWKWAGHIARTKDDRWKIRSTEWQIKA